MKSRKQQIVRTGYLGIATNILVAVVKAIVGVASASMAIVLDAVNNMTDALSSIITIVGVKLAGRPADDSHPFGYGRIEYFAAVIISAMILAAGGASLIESIKGIITPETQTYTTVGLVIIGISVVAKYFLGVYTRRKGKELNSDALVSSGTECMFDCLVSCATLLSAVVMMIFNVSLDCWLAAAIACLIIKTGVEMLMSPVSELLGKRSDQKFVAALKDRVRTLDGVRGVFDVVLHNYGPEQQIGALHVEVDDTMSAVQLHRLTHQIQRLVLHEFGLFVTVGFYAHHSEGTEASREEQRVRDHVCGINGVLGVHGFYVSHADRLLTFDIVYSFKVSQPITLRDNVLKWLQTTYKDYDINIGLDRNYSE